MAKSSGETPLMQQHNSIKAKYPDAILLFRVGDFYETFGNDAVTTAKILGITLTKRNNGNPDAAELAGFPHHALDTYLHKLVKAGYRVAICDQLEDPKQAKGIVKRGVTELVTPGVATNDKLLEHNSNNFLAAIHFSETNNENDIGIAFIDISTGEFFVAECNTEYCDKLLQSMQPAEIIFAKTNQKKFKEFFGLSYFTYTLDEWIFSEQYSEESLLKHFGTHSLKGFGVDNLPFGIIASGAILHYLKETEHPNLQHINTLQRISKEDYLWMDRFTIQNLELICDNDRHSLFKTINNTVSPMGARLLRRWLLMPLNEIKKINERLETVDFLTKTLDVKTNLIESIKKVGDIERLAAKIPGKKINPREVIQLAKALQESVTIKNICGNTKSEFLQKLSNTINGCEYISEKIINLLNENSPIAINKGGLISQGINAELDELRSMAGNHKNYLLTLQQKESLTTGISSLKIAFNNVFGYYLEVTNLHKNKVPQNWIRKQTLANAERYITPELKEYEEKILTAEDKILAIEIQLYQNLLDELQGFIAPMQVNGQSIAIIDCLTCFANNATKNKYCLPKLHNEYMLELKDSRHPVIEQYLPQGESYISNDIYLDNETQQLIILTGPNMSGKSAILRQTALITLMAHIGSFVPAKDALIPLTDKIFTRVGASDNLSAGESTFMVEMNETASILNNLTARSLILLDEIGRGTSTYDGISIAWSIAEYLHESGFAPKTLFATHYHEMNELENKFSRIKNYHITNKEVGNKIIFLRKLAKGGSTHSFGIHVARMAGMPQSLINRANEILAQLESDKDGKTLESKSDMQEKVKNINSPKMQLSIFDSYSITFEEIRQALANVDINRLTPVEALLKLQEIKLKIGQ